MRYTNIMKLYVVLLRGINVGGKNKVSMANLRTYLEELGFSDVATYIASGNVILGSNKTPQEIQQLIEALLPKKFKLDSELIKALVLDYKQLKAIINSKPQGFGDKPDIYYSDAIFLMGITSKEAMPAFDPREGVDAVWPGPNVIYSQRLGELRTKSRLSKVISSPLYKSMTIRSWSTTTKLLQILDNLHAAKKKAL